MFLYNFFFTKKEVRPLLIGIEGSGKSCYLHRCMFNEYLDKVPESIGGSGRFVFENHQAKFNIVDLKGDVKSRELWSNYYENIDVVVFAVDTKDEGKFEEVKKVIHEFIPKIEQSIPVLILGTKADLNGANEEELIEKLKLKDLKRKVVDVMLVSSKTSESILDSIDWIVSF